jgi:NACHT domain/Restriction endonuclease
MAAFDRSTLDASSSRYDTGIQVPDYAASPRSGKPFESRVADAYRSLGFHVVEDVQLPGQQVDLLARTKVPGSPEIVLAVECKSGRRKVGNDGVNDFLAWSAALRDSRRITGASLVAQAGFTKDARGGAEENPYVELLTWRELSEQLFDVRHNLRAIVERYESSEIHGQYLALDLAEVPWFQFRGGGRTARRANELRQIVAASARTFPSLNTGSLVVLADFGAGKTTLLRHIEYVAAKSRLEDSGAPIPLFVALREFRASYDLPALLRTSFREAYHCDVAWTLLWEQIESGRMLLLLDGFDEMLPRSDRERRAELFHELAPIITSRSPAILTSRPSHFVEHAELQSLVSAMVDVEELLAQDASNVSARNGKDLQRLLIATHREVRPGLRLQPDVGPGDLSVGRFKPLDKPLIEAFLDHHEHDLRRAGVSVGAVVDFIVGTYDLYDLATRPLLLNFIVKTIVSKHLNIDDRPESIGPSSLYESYTTAQLAIDLDKGPTRRGGLTLDLRRVLAQELALYLYRNDALEVDVREFIERSLDDLPSVASAIGQLGLTVDETMTDFATCSFITKNDDGTCRFVHKSLRGFFIARSLLEHVTSGHPMISETPLEWEALYFLGGYAPSHPWVAHDLLHQARRGTKDALRRNAFMAFLYTRHEHANLTLADGRVDSCEFSRLRFSQGAMSAVHWSDCTIKRLELTETKWEAVWMRAVQVGHLQVADSTLALELAGTSIEDMDIEKSTAVLEAEGGAVDCLKVNDSDVRVHGSDLSLEALSVRASTLCLSSSAQTAPCRIERFDAKLSTLDLRGAEIAACHVRASRVKMVAPARGRQASVSLAGSFLEIDGTVGRNVGGNLRIDAADHRSIVAGQLDISQLRRLRCGFFGRPYGSVAGLEAILEVSPAWGVVDVIKPRRKRSFRARAGNFLLVDSATYRQFLSVDGPLSEIWRTLHNDASSPEVECAHLDELLAAIWSEYAALLNSTR